MEAGNEVSDVEQDKMFSSEIHGKSKTSPQQNPVKMYTSVSISINSKLNCGVEFGNKATTSPCGCIALDLSL